MAFIQNDKGEWAWVTFPDDTPKFAKTKDEAIKLVRPPRTRDSAATMDSVTVHTVEGAEIEK